MKQLFSLCLTSLILILGCTRLHTVNHSYFTYMQLNKELKEKQGFITLAKGDVISAGNLSVSLDSTSYVELISQQEQMVSTAEIGEIIIPNESKGRFYRIGISLLGGAFGGAFSGVIIGSTFTNQTSGFGIYPKYGCLLGMVAGGIFGLVYEATGGTTHKYLMNPSKEGTHANMNSKNGTLRKESSGHADPNHSPSISRKND